MSLAIGNKVWCLRREPDIGQSYHWRQFQGHVVSFDPATVCVAAWWWTDDAIMFFAHTEVFLSHAEAAAEQERRNEMEFARMEAAEKAARKAARKAKRGPG